MKAEISNYLNSLDLDVRKKGSARFMDQKCTPDVVCAVAECILEYTSKDENLPFTKDDIWHSDYANELIKNSFTKPDLSEESVNSEYDKFFAQPMKLLAYCNVLNEIQDGANYYTVNHREILSFISRHERNAIDFLDAYLSKVMTDSGMIKHFNEFYEKQDRTSLYNLRERLMTFYHTYTKVKNESLFSTSKSDKNGDVNVYVSSVERTYITPPLILREKPDVIISTLRVFT